MIKKNLSLFTILTILTISGIAQTQMRQKESFNNDWKFILSDSTAYGEADFNDSAWRVLDLPHDWSVEGEFSKKHSGRNAWLPGGIAWYRKEFFVAKEDEGKHFEIQFDGIYRHSKIWINGVFVGIQYDGYTSFYFDVTEVLRFGQTNSIAVRVDNSIQPNCRWYSGSGIYRNVWLTKTNPLHVKNWGTYITTPTVSEENAEVLVQTTIENGSLENRNFVLETTIVNSEGNEVAKAENPGSIGLLNTANIKQKITISNPELWSLDETNLYTAISKVKIDGEVVDDYTSNFGIRTLEFDAKKGFFLNGKNMKMKGVCIHHDGGAFGGVVPLQVWERRLRNLKALGCNAIRTAHNPPAPEFLDLCDKIGFLVMDEFVDKWNNVDAEFEFYAAPFADPYFHSEWQKNFRETIRRDRNHPSIVIWSVGNENHAPGSERQNLGLKRYCSFVRSIDPTRPVISGMERGKDLPVDEKVDDIIKSCSFMDLIALNYGEQWCKLISEKNPGKPYVSTESYTYFNSSEEKRWANRESNPWLDVMANDFNMGLYLWVGINYLGESRSWPGLGSGSGLLDMAGFRTVRSELFEAFWSEKPVLHIEVYKGDADDFSKTGRWGWPHMSKHWNHEKGKKYDLVTYTNCDEVDLYLNNKKIGSQKLADFPNWIMKWKKIEYKPGTLRAVGKINGEEVCSSELKTVGDPAKLKFDIFKPELTSGDIVQVEVTLTDKKGNVITDNDRRINFQLEGEGEILVLSNGKMKTEENLQQKESKSTFLGKALCVIKAGDNAKTLKLSAFGDDIKLSSVDINID